MSGSTVDNPQLSSSSVNTIREIAARHHARHPRLFGSHSSGTATGSSDIDLLVECDPEADLYDLIALKQDLQDALGCDVDVVEEAALSPYLRDQVLSEARPL